MGNSLLGQKKFEEAEQHLLGTYTGLTAPNMKLGATAKTRLRETVQSLVLLYETTDQPAKVAEWKKRLGELEEPKVAPR